MDVPDMGYLTTDEPPRGEICIKSANTIQGYYKNQEETKEKFIDGYFRTGVCKKSNLLFQTMLFLHLKGDIGIQESSGSFRIIDRKKNIFKLAQGEFVVPERIEAVFESNSSLIEQVFLYGNSTETGTLAVVVPFQQALMHWWNQRHLGGWSARDMHASSGTQTTQICSCYSLAAWCLARQMQRATSRPCAHTRRYKICT